MQFLFQSTEYRDSSKVENLTDVDGLQSSLSADDSADLFCEDSGKSGPLFRLLLLIEMQQSFHA